MRRVILAICATAAALVLLLSFKTHTQSGLGTPAAALGTPTPGAGDAASTASPAATTSGPAKAGTAKSAGPSSAAAASAAKTVTGDAVQTIYGPVQLQVTVQAGKVTAVHVLQYPDGTSRDYEINSYAIPQLTQEAIGASSANIDMVSGATYTSQGYIGSLQSALDKAKA